MFDIEIFWRRTIAVLLLFFLSGCTPSKDWVYQEVRSKHSESSSVCLTLNATNAFNGIELQLLKTSYGTFAYLGVHSRSIPAQTDNLVILVVDDKAHGFPATAMEGRQHLLLTDEATQLLIDSLQNKQKVIIAIAGGFVAEVPADQFNNQYRKFSKL